MPPKAATGNSPAKRDEPLPMALRVLEDLLAGHLLVYPANLSTRHGGKREAWYKCCAMLAEHGWLTAAQTGDALAYRAGPKCWAIGDATLNGLDREYDALIDGVVSIGHSLRAMRRDRADAQRRREAATQPPLPIAEAMNSALDLVMGVGAAEARSDGDTKFPSAGKFDPNSIQTDPQTQGAAS